MATIASMNVRITASIRDFDKKIRAMEARLLELDKRAARFSEAVDRKFSKIADSADRTTDSITRMSRSFDTRAFSDSVKKAEKDITALRKSSRANMLLGRVNAEGYKQGIREARAELMELRRLSKTQTSLGAVVVPASTGGGGGVAPAPSPRRGQSTAGRMTRTLAFGLADYADSASAYLAVGGADAIARGARGGGFGGAMAGIAGFGALAGIGVLAGTTAAGAPFEYMLDRIAAKSNATEAELLALKKTALDLGSSTTLSANEVAAAMDQMSAAGFNAKDIIGAMPGVIAAAEASGEDLAMAMETVTSAMHTFNIKATESTHVADVIAEVANRSSATIKDLRDGIKYAGASAQAVGIDFEELSASLGILRDRGLSGSTAGRYLRQVLSRIAAPTEKAKAVMDKYNITLTDAKGNFLSLSDMVKELNYHLKGMSPKQQLGILKTIFGNEGATAVLQLMHAGDERLRSFAQHLRDVEGSAARAAAKLRDNFLGAVEQLSGELETLGIHIFDSNAPWMTGAVRGLTNFFGRINDTIALKNLDKKDMAFLRTSDPELFKKVVQIKNEPLFDTILRGALGEDSVWFKIYKDIQEGDWEAVGRELGKGLKRAIKAADWEGIGAALAEGLKRATVGAFAATKDMISSFFEELGVPPWASTILGVLGGIAVAAVPTLKILKALRTLFITWPTKGIQGAKSVVDRLKDSLDNAKNSADKLKRSMQDTRDRVSGTNRYGRNYRPYTKQVIDVEVRDRKAKTKLGKLTNSLKNMGKAKHSAGKVDVDTSKAESKIDRLIKKIKDFFKGGGDGGGPKGGGGASVGGKMSKGAKAKTGVPYLDRIVLGIEVAKEAFNTLGPSIALASANLANYHRENSNALIGSQLLTQEGNKPLIRKENLSEVEQKALQAYLKSEHLNKSGNKPLNKKTNLPKVTNQIAAATAQAGVLNSVLGRSIHKRVNISVNVAGGIALSTIRSLMGFHSGGIVPETYHNGGIVGKYHSGNIVQGAGTVPANLWGGEMVLTRGQQAQLFNMLQYGNSQGESREQTIIVNNYGDGDKTGRSVVDAMRRREWLDA